MLLISVNERNLFHYELTRNSPSGNNMNAANVGGATVDRHKGKEVVDYGEDGQ
jgi:hypothetical protein